jgi:hypothetical protein
MHVAVWRSNRFSNHSQVGIYRGRSIKSAQGAYPAQGAHPARSALGDHGALCEHCALGDHGFAAFYAVADIHQDLTIRGHFDVGAGAEFY